MTKKIIKSYMDLEVWQKSMDMVEEIYRLSKLLPKDEIFGLRAQMRRSAVSVAANIAEGHGRLHRADYLRHLSFAKGSLAETETHLQIAVRLSYLQRSDAKKAWAILQSVGRLLGSLIHALERSQVSPRSKSSSPSPQPPAPSPSP